MYGVPHQHPTWAAPSNVPCMGSAERTDRDAVLPVIIGTIAWAVALVVLIVLRGSLIDGTRWIGVSVVGLITGVLLSLYLVRRRRRLD